MKRMTIAREECVESKYSVLLDSLSNPMKIDQSLVTLCKEAHDAIEELMENETVNTESGEMFINVEVIENGYIIEPYGRGFGEYRPKYHCSDIGDCLNRIESALRFVEQKGTTKSEKDK